MIVTQPIEIDITPEAVVCLLGAVAIGWLVFGGLGRGAPNSSQSEIASDGNNSARPCRCGRCPKPIVQMYRTLDGISDYKFRFVLLGEKGFRIYILETPGNLKSSPHRLRDSTGPYICWSVPIDSYERAQKIAAQWAEATEKFRKTGKSF